MSRPTPAKLTRKRRRRRRPFQFSPVEVEMFLTMQRFIDAVVYPQEPR